MARAALPAALSLLAVLTALAGCAGEVSSLAPRMPSFPWASGVASDPGQAPRSTVALTATIEGLQCAEGRIVLARAAAAGLERVAQLSLPATYAGRSTAGIVALEPGEYHLVSYSCRNGGNVTYLGRGPGDDEIPWAAALYPESLASFTVGRNETLVAGALRINRKPGSGSLVDAADREVTLTADTLSTAELAMLTESHPELAVDAIVARTMAVGAPAERKPRRLAKCVLVAEGAAAPAPAQHQKPKAKGAAAGFALLTGPEAEPTACRKGKGIGDTLDRLVNGAP